MTVIIEESITHLDFDVALPCERSDCEDDHPPATWKSIAQCGHCELACTPCRMRWREWEQHIRANGGTCSCRLVCGGCSIVALPWEHLTWEPIS